MGEPGINELMDVYGRHNETARMLVATEKDKIDLERGRLEYCRQFDAEAKERTEARWQDSIKLSERNTAAWERIAGALERLAAAAEKP